VVSTGLRLGFDSDFDRSAPLTRAQARERVSLSVAVLAVSWIAVGPVALSWWVLLLVAEAMLWRATDPAFMARDARAARTLRLAASTLSSSAWSFCALLMWFAGSQVSSLMAVALLAAIAIFIIGACHETPIHMIASGSPPALGLLILPFSMSAPLGERVLLASSMALLVFFAASSIIRAHRTHIRLKETRSQLEQQTRSAQAANRAKSEFLANMSHEIRTPLNGVLAVSEALSRTRLSAQQRHMLGLVSSSGMVLQQLLSDLLDLARIETARMEIHPVPFHLRQALMDVIQLHAPAGEAKGLSFVLDFDDAVDGWVLGDLVRFKQVLTNLVSNAVKFTEAGTVTVRARPAPSTGGFEFSVEDTGVGFTPETRERLFHRFEQADSSITRRFGGSGLGLSICGQLVELMNGDLTCESEPGRGSVFRFTLPLPPCGGAAEATAAPLARLTRRLRVLVADDHPTNRKVVELVLSQADVDLVMVEDGAQAVEAVGTASFDAILMDMQMPVMDGLTATRAIRRLEDAEGRRRTPIIMLTANALPEHVEQAMAAGADHHIAKPLKTAELLEALGALGDTAPEAASDAA